MKRIEDAVARGFRDRIHFVEYEELTENPDATLRAIYEFLGEQPFTHDLGNIVPGAAEDDMRLGIPGLHRIHPQLRPTPSISRKFLGAAASRYDDASRFWRQSAPAAAD